MLSLRRYSDRGSSAAEGSSRMMQPEGFAKVRDIKTGIEDNDNIEVLNGLKVEDQLIVRGYETLRDNSKIKIQK